MVWPFDACYDYEPLPTAPSPPLFTGLVTRSLGGGVGEILTPEHSDDDHWVLLVAGLSRGGISGWGVAGFGRG